LAGRAIIETLRRRFAADEAIELLIRRRADPRYIAVDRDEWHYDAHVVT
jgi:hypothetical protein